MKNPKELKKLAVVGGDKRMTHLAALLAAEGWTVDRLEEWEAEKIHGEQVVLLPYPISVKNGVIPSQGGRIRADVLLQSLPSGAVVLAGRGIESCEIPQNVRLIRYADDPELETRNAELSAEAAVCECMLHSRLALLDSRVLITGYGLFGRATARRLKALGAEVWVAARRQAQRDQAMQDGMQTVSIREMPDVLPRMDLILNTVPSGIFDEYALRRIPHECWLLELASAPYGFCMDMAKALGVSCALLPGLPGKYSPLSAAKALREAVVRLLGEES